MKLLITGGAGFIGYHLAKLFVSKNYQVDLYKDILMYSHNLSNMSKTNIDLRLIASMYATENGLDDVILINDQKKISHCWRRY